jgi:hypothetical protein
VIDKIRITLEPLDLVHHLIPKQYICKYTRAIVFYEVLNSSISFIKDLNCTMRITKVVNVFKIAKIVDLSMSKNLAAENRGRISSVIKIILCIFSF